MTKLTKMLSYMGYTTPIDTTKIAGINWIGKMAKYHNKFNYLSDKQKSITELIIHKATGVELRIKAVKHTAPETPVRRQATVKILKERMYKNIPHTTTHELPFSSAVATVMTYNDNYLILDLGDKYYKVPKPNNYVDKGIVTTKILVRKTKHKGFLKIA